ATHGFIERKSVGTAELLDARPVLACPPELAQLGLDSLVGPGPLAAASLGAPRRAQTVARGGPFSALDDQPLLLEIAQIAARSTATAPGEALVVGAAELDERVGVGLRQPSLLAWAELDASARAEAEGLQLGDSSRDPLVLLGQTAKEVLEPGVHVEG